MSQVQAALEQLAGNPLFKENPGCLGGFIQELLKASVPAAVPNKDEQEPSPKDMDVKALDKPGPDATHDAAAPTPKSELAAPDGEPGGDAPKPAYKAFWSQFKRQPSKQEVVAVDTATGADGAGPAAAVATEKVREERPDLSEHEREVMAYVDNQLGDPTLYPADTMAELGRQGSIEDTLMDPSPEKPETILDTPNKAVETPVPETDVVTPCKPVVVPVNSTSPKEHVFAPTAEDVKACLFRKTTLDMMASPAAAAAPMASPSSAAAAVALVPPTPAAPAIPSLAIPVAPTPAAPAMPSPAVPPTPPAPLAPATAAAPVPSPSPVAPPAPTPAEAPAQTSVMMNLGGVMQPVLVPLSRDAALAAGLTPTDAYVPPEPQKPSPGETPAQPEASIPEDAETTMDDGPDSKAVMKAAYMRFHRSVNSTLERYIYIILCTS